MFELIVIGIVAAFAGMGAVQAVRDHRERRSEQETESSGGDEVLEQLIERRTRWANVSEHEARHLALRGVKVTCPRCGQLLGPAMPRCSRCGFVFKTVAWDDAMARGKIRLADKSGGGYA